MRAGVARAAAQREAPLLPLTWPPPRPRPPHLLPSLPSAEQQELFETANGGLQELSNGRCLCPDTRGSSTPSPSPTPSTPPPSDGAAAARAAEARSLGLGLGIPLGLLAAGALALYAASLATGTPIVLLVKGGLGSLGGGGVGGSGSGSGSGSLFRQSALGGAGGAQASSRAKELLSTEATGLLRSA